MEKSFPFNARYTGGSFDRVYSADDWAEERASYISNGILTEGSLLVAPGGGMTVTVAAGRACIKGRTYFNTESMALTLAVSSEAAQRIDLLVLRLDTEERTVLLAVKSSEVTADPVVPDCTVSETVTEIPIAAIRIGLDASEITEADITDLRVMAKYPLNYDSLYQEYVEKLREEFGSGDMALVSKLGELIRLDGDGTMALCDDGTYKSLPQIVCGTYRINSASERTMDVTLGFRPKAVYVCRQAHPTSAYVDGNMNVYGGMAMDGFAACHRVDISSGVETYAVMITDTGFRVMTNTLDSSAYKYLVACRGTGGGDNELVGLYMAIR